MSSSIAVSTKLDWSELIEKWKRRGLGGEKSCEKNNVLCLLFRCKPYYPIRWLQTEVTNTSVYCAEGSANEQILKRGKISIEAKPDFDESHPFLVVKVLIALRFLFKECVYKVFWDYLSLFITAVIFC